MQSKEHDGKKQKKSKISSQSLSMGNSTSVSFVIVLDGSVYKPMYEHMLMDLVNCPNVTFVIDNKNNTNKLKTILIKDKVRKIVGEKFDFIAFEKNSLYKTLCIEMKKKEETVVIFLNASLYYNSYLTGTIRQYKKIWPALKLVLFYLDVVGSGVSKNADYIRQKGLFDLVYTIDAIDAEKIQAIIWTTFYSADLKLVRSQPTVDLYFCGASKDRGNIIKSCAEQAASNNVVAEMDIICYKESQQFDGVPGIHVRSADECMNYPEVLAREISAKCLLEIVQKGQTALTLRPYEAVAYNLKILSNARSILSFKFYNEKYMRYFERVEDIDWNWVKEDVVVDYGYENEFSPEYLLRDIEERLY